MQNDRIIEKLNNIEAFTGRATYFLEYGVRVKDGVKVYNHSDEPLYTRNK